jgi:hypothetical protein
MGDKGGVEGEYGNMRRGEEGTIRERRVSDNGDQKGARQKSRWAKAG